MAEGDDLGNPVPIILGVVIAAVLTLMAYVAWVQKHAPPQPKRKEKGAKAIKRERLRQGLAPPE
jgi:uncharacterized membrane protein